MTATRRDIRHLTVQILYQLDVRSVDDWEAIEEYARTTPTSPAGNSNTYSEDDASAALLMAKQAWHVHDQADKLATEYAPTWPTSRQPVVDRNIIRLAYYEMASKSAPVKVAIDEAIELAKLYGTDKSPAFINGILDRIMHTLEANPVDVDFTEAKATTPEDAWLKDAINGDEDHGSV